MTRKNQGVLFALLSTILYSLGGLLMKGIPSWDGLALNAGRSVISISSVFYGAFVGVIIGFPSMLAAAPLGGSELVNMLALGALQTGLAYVFLVLSLETTPAITASLISGIQPVLSPILVAIVYGETMGPISFAGAAVVILGVLTYNVIKAREATPTHTSSAESASPA